MVGNTRRISLKCDFCKSSDAMARLGPRTLLWSAKTAKQARQVDFAESGKISVIDQPPNEKGETPLGVSPFVLGFRASYLVASAVPLPLLALAGGLAGL